jgi:hypothetical protein
LLSDPSWLGPVVVVIAWRADLILGEFIRLVIFISRAVIIVWLLAGGRNDKDYVIALLSLMFGSATDQRVGPNQDEEPAVERLISRKRG